MNTEFAELFKLSRAERIQLVEDLWDSIAGEEPPMETSAEKLEELQSRREKFRADPEAGLSWEQVKDQARSRHE